MSNHEGAAQLPPEQPEEHLNGEQPVSDEQREEKELTFKEWLKHFLWGTENRLY